MSTPYAFICHASEDKDLARKLATDLRSNGIDTFFDEWEIRSGDSLRQKIDDGLGHCTHFLALLSPISLTKPWVNSEIDAAFVRKVSAQAALIPIRLNIEPNQLPPLLAALSAPSIDNYKAGLATLVEDIYGLTKKPTLGISPVSMTSSWAGRSGLSVGAATVAEVFLRRSTRGRSGDPHLEVSALRDATGYSDEQLIDAVDELEAEALVKPRRVIGAPPFGYRDVGPTDSLFAFLDAAVMGWVPTEDARVVATTLLNEYPDGARASKLSERLGWSPRRLNPALTILCSRAVVLASNNIDRTFVTPWIGLNNSTRRFVRNG